MSSPEAIAPQIVPPPRRVLIVLLGAIGDVVRALPLLGRIRNAWPDAHIAWAVEPKSKAVLEHHRWLDEIIVYDRAHAPWTFLPFLQRVRRGHFDLVIDLQRHLKSGLTSRISGARDRFGFAAPNTKEFNYLFSNHQIAPQPNMRLKLDAVPGVWRRARTCAIADRVWTRRDRRRTRPRARDAADAPRPLLAVILGSSWPSRIYFPESTAAVVRRVAVADSDSPALFPVLLGGPDETKLADEVMRHLDDVPALNLAGRTSLRDLIAIFPECAVAFGPDSGPMHIAAAVGCPVVSLWGATAAERSAPWGFADLAISGAIPCHPCYLRKCPIGRECMRRISPEEVGATVRRALATREAPR